MCSHKQSKICITKIIKTAQQITINVGLHYMQTCRDGTLNTTNRTITVTDSSVSQLVALKDAVLQVRTRTRRQKSLALASNNSRCQVKLSVDHMCCRQVPVSETTEVARFLSRLLSCDVDSLPTALFVHTYWKNMPTHFAAASAYIRCLQARTRTINATRCQSLNPYYCGQRFGEYDDLGRLRVCRQLLSSSDTRAAAAGANYAVPPRALTNIINYRACLARIRATVTSQRLEKYLGFF